MIQAKRIRYDVIAVTEAGRNVNLPQNIIPVKNCSYEGCNDRKHEFEVFVNKNFEHEREEQFCKLCENLTIEISPFLDGISMDPKGRV